MSCKSDWRDTLLVTTIIPSGSKWIKSTRTSYFAFLSNLLILVTWSNEFFIKLEIFSLPMGMMTCFLNRPFVVIWMCGLGLELPLTILLIWLIFFALIEENVFLILMTSDILMFCFEAWAYDLDVGLDLLSSFLLLKYFKIVLTSFWDFTGIDGGIHSICTRMGLLISLLFLLLASWIFGVNLVEIFLLRELACLSASRES